MINVPCSLLSDTIFIEMVFNRTNLEYGHSLLNCLNYSAKHILFRVVFDKIAVLVLRVLVLAFMKIQIIKKCDLQVGPHKT